MSKILLLSKGYPPETGGLESYARQVGAAYAAAGHDVVVVTACGAPQHEFDDHDVHVINVGIASQPVILLHMINVLRRFEADAFDLVHATTWRTAIPAFIRGFHGATVLTVHGREVFIVPTLLRPVMSTVLRRADAVVGISAPIMSKLHETVRPRLRREGIAWNGVSFQRLAESHLPNPNPRHIFCVCRLVERKNLHGAIRALVPLKLEGLNFRFSIAGSGPEHPRLMALIRELHLENYVTLLGRITDEDMLRRYRSSGIFLHPQIAAMDGGDIEGFGITIADAMSFGAAVIAGQSGGPSDFIQHRKTGLLIDARQDACITDAVRYLLTAQAEQLRLGLAAREFALRELTWTRHINQVVSLAHK